MSQRISRRYFFFGTLLAGAVPPGGFSSAQSLKMLGYKSPNEKLNIAGIGAGGRPFADLVASEAGVENIVALTDVDWERGQQGFSRWPKAEKYRDFRQMIDRQGKSIDAVVIGTADHMHATCALYCMQAGKHVYVEKPLTRTPWEARLLTQAAEKYKVATQMGNQGYSHDATRVACEILWSGEIGEVREVHAWHGGPGWPQGMQKIPPPTPVPSTLDWQLWLGGAADRPYTAGDDEYHAYAAQVMGARGAARGPAPDGAMAAEPGAGGRRRRQPRRRRFRMAHKKAGGSVSRNSAARSWCPVTSLCASAAPSFTPATASAWAATTLCSRSKRAPCSSTRGSAAARLFR